MMNKMAFYSDFIYYNNEIHNNSYLLVTDNIIDGISNNCLLYTSDAADECLFV